MHVDMINLCDPYIWRNNCNLNNVHDDENIENMLITKSVFGMKENIFHKMFPNFSCLVGSNVFQKNNFLQIKRN